MYTEQEMKDFFQNIIDQVSTLSTQASRVDGLEQRVRELTQRLDELSTTNYNLQHEVAEVNRRLVSTEDQLNSTRRDYENEMAVTRNLRDVITGRDSKVQEVETNLETERQAHRVTLSERDDARHHAVELDEQVTSFRTNYHQANERANEWERKAHEFERQAADYKQQLDKIQSLLNPLRVVSGDVQSVG